MAAGIKGNGSRAAREPLSRMAPGHPGHPLFQTGSAPPKLPVRVALTDRIGRAKLEGLVETVPGDDSVRFERDRSVRIE